MTGAKRVEEWGLSSQALPDVVARIKPRYVDGDLANAHPAELLDSSAHVRAQILDG